jgi:hypothetical protein
MGVPWVMSVYSLVSLCLGRLELPKDPKLVKAFFRVIEKPKISRKVNIYPDQLLIEQESPKKSLVFSDIDLELQQTLDAIFEHREFLPGTLAKGSKPNCYFCNFEKDCEGLIDRFSVR